MKSLMIVAVLGLLVLGMSVVAAIADDLVITKTTKLPTAMQLFCEKRGYSYEARIDGTGKTSWVCAFPDGKECAEMEFIRGSCGKAYANATRADIMDMVVSRMQERLADRDCKDGCSIDVGDKNVNIKDLSAGRREIIANKINAKTGMNLTAEEINSNVVLKAYLSNGKWAVIKTMPDSASEVAQERLQIKCAERNCTLELKEVAVNGKPKIAYDVSTKRDSKLFGLFKKNMPVVAQVDADSGEVTSVKRPWWAFLAKETGASDSSDSKAQ
jgi:putative hemolysin